MNKYDELNIWKRGLPLYIRVIHIALNILTRANPCYHIKKIEKWEDRYCLPHLFSFCYIVIVSAIIALACLGTMYIIIII